MAKYQTSSKNNYPIILRLLFRILSRASKIMMVVICTLGLLLAFDLRDESADLVATTCTRIYTIRLLLLLLF